MSNGTREVLPDFPTGSLLFGAVNGNTPYKEGFYRLTEIETLTF
jgi:hypothetical protein